MARMKTRRAILASFLAVFLLGAAPAGKTVRLLTIGNSFSGNATRFLGDLAKAGGHTLVLQPMSVGGASMEVHWTKIEANEKDPKDPAGLYGTRALSKTLAEGWDYVTIQQASIKSHDVETYRPFAAKLQAYVKTHAPKAELLLHQTWAYRVDDPRFGAKTAKAGEPATREAMHAGLCAAYAAIAKELGVRRIPVGDAFQLADGDPAWGFKPDLAFDRKAAVAPALPDQTHSLHVGWKWSAPKDGKPAALGMDGHHANAAGEFLGACVWYEVLFQESVLGNPFAPKDLKPEDVDFLRKAAHRAVEAAK